jgi:hypothetical protein
MKNRIFSIFAWSLFTAITLMSLVSLFYGFTGKGYSTRDVLPLFGELFWGLLPVVFAFQACLIIGRQPGNAIGWLLLLPAVALANDGTLVSYFGSFATAPPDPSLPFLLVLWFYGWNWLLLIFPVFLIILLFPTGKPASRRWRWVTNYVWIVFLVFFVLIAFGTDLAPQNIDWSIPNPAGFVPDRLAQAMFIYAVGLLSTTILSVSSIIFRYRSATTIEREQIKWLLYAVVIFAVIYLSMIMLNLGTDTWDTTGLFNLLLPLSLMTIPAAITVAMLRYRLWDIDLIIRKTLVYGLLTTALVLLYFGLVTLLQSLSASVFGLQSPVIIVLSTLVIAALFNPLRIRIQDQIDRRFYRKKYDAEVALARFAQAARNETDIQCLNEALLEVIQETVQPEEIRIWIKQSRRA